MHANCALRTSCASWRSRSGPVLDCWLTGSDTAHTTPTDSAPLTTEEVAAQDKAPDTVEDTLGVEAVCAIGIDPVASTGIHMEHATSAGEQQSHPTEETTELPHAEDTTRCKEN